MTAPDTPLLRDEQRDLLASGGRTSTGSFGTASITVRVAAENAVAEIDRLRAQVDALATELAYVCHDRMEDGAARLVERAVSEEREACRVLLANEAKQQEDLEGDRPNDQISRRVLIVVVRRLVHAIAFRGPILPPLPPTVMQQRYEEAMAVLRRIVEADKRIGEGVPFRPTLSQAIEAARELLEKEQ